MLAVLLCAIVAATAPGQASTGSNGQIAAIRPMDPGGEAKTDGSRTQLEDALRALKHSKQLGRLEAEQALASIDAFRQARRDRKPPLPLEADLQTCIAAPTADCLLREALAHAYRVPDQGRRDWALSAVATAYFETGAHDRIYPVLALMEDPRAALRMLEQTVGSEQPAQAIPVSARSGRNTDASQDGSGGDGDGGASAAWVPAAEAGDWAAARRGIGVIAEPRYRAVAWARLGRMAIAAGEPALAEEALQASEALIAEIEFSYARSYARYEASLTHIARVAHTGGGDAETNDAAESAAKIEQPHFRADAFWRLASVGSATRAPGIQAQAEQSFTEIGSRLRKVFVLTAEEVKSDQRKARALDIAATIQDPLDRARAFTRLARHIR